jgi:hypothetical protein
MQAAVACLSYGAQPRGLVDQQWAKLPSVPLSDFVEVSLAYL